MLIGYARVSTRDQDLEVQIEQLQAAGCDKIFFEKKTGSSTAGRTQLEAAVDFAREGDTLLVTRLDRMARSATDLLNLIQRLAGKQVQFRCLQQSEINTDTSTGRMLVTVLAAIAQFETDIRSERQKEGIDKRKSLGGYPGRKVEIDADQVKQMALANPRWGASRLARELGIGRATVYRKLAEPAPRPPSVGPSLADLIKPRG